MFRAPEDKLVTKKPGNHKPSVSNLTPKCEMKKIPSAKDLPMRLRERCDVRGSQDVTAVFLFFFLFAPEHSRLSVSYGRLSRDCHGGREREWICLAFFLVWTGGGIYLSGGF